MLIAFHKLYSCWSSVVVCLWSARLARLVKFYWNGQCAQFRCDCYSMSHIMFVAAAVPSVVVGMVDGECVYFFFSVTNFHAVIREPWFSVEAQSLFFCCPVPALNMLIDFFHLKFNSDIHFAWSVFIYCSEHLLPISYTLASVSNKQVSKKKKKNYVRL